jgi:hypothetical protein
MAKHEREVEIAATIKEVPLRQLLDAIRDHAEDLNRWLSESPREIGDWVVGPDRRLLDFTPLESWQRILSILSAAEARAKHNLRAQRSPEAQ